jgi:glutamine amidotransferase-like uncharacterized protein
MLVMPGGADLPYCRQLNGPGNDLIRGAAHHHLNRPLIKQAGS